MIKLSDLIFKIKTLDECIVECNNLLSESPTRISNWDNNKLNNRNENYAFCKVIKEKGDNVDKYKNYDVYQFKSSEVTDIFTSDDFIQAYFNYEIKNNIVIEKRVWQDELHLGLCRDIIFNYYLKKFKGIISDGLHSPMGEKYWKKLLKHALESGYEIYAIDISNNDAVALNLDDIDKFYSYTTSSENYRFFVKNK